MTPLANTTAVVSGSSRGIGRATVEALRAHGARVVGLARSVAPRQERDRWDIRCDLTDSSAVASAVERILADWGPPDLLVNNAGGFLVRPFERTEPRDLQAQLAINLQAPFALAARFVPAMRQAGRGLVIHVGSIADHVGYPENAAYAASKYGLRGLHESLVAEFRGTGIRFSLISPGPTDTDLWDPVDPDHREGFLPRSKMLRSADVAEAIVFLATRPAHVHVDWLRLGPA